MVEEHLAKTEDSIHYCQNEFNVARAEKSMEEQAKTILLVEDHAVVAEVEVRQLSREGYHVIHSLTGEDAIDQVFNKQHKIDLILMDIDLGSPLDGTKVAQMILESFDIPVVFLSSHIEKEVVETTEKITSYGYVLKSSGITVLAATIKLVFKLHRAHTELKEKEASLRASEQRLRFHLENSPLAVVEWDTDYVVILWSIEAERLFGWTADEVIGKKIDQLGLIYEEDLPIVQKTMERLTSGEERTVVSANRNYTKSRTVVPCKWYNSVLVDESGKMASVMSLVQDLTERKPEECFYGAL
jgi:PAS domain S-box-containing protein